MEEKEHVFKIKEIKSPSSFQRQHYTQWKMLHLLTWLRHIMIWPLCCLKASTWCISSSEFGL